MSVYFQRMDCGVLMGGYNDPSMRTMMAESSVQAQLQHPLTLEPSLTLEMLAEKQKQENDLLVQQHNNQLRNSILQQSKNHLLSTLQTLESKAAWVIRKKDSEIAMAKNRALQLESCIIKLQQEKDVWEKFAVEKEALARSLNNALQQLQNPCLSSTGSSRDQEDEENDETSNNYAVGSNCCKICGVHDSCMLFLPCRHVCSCELCEASIESCPVCGWRKEASVEVFWG